MKSFYYFVAVVTTISAPALADESQGGGWSGFFHKAGSIITNVKSSVQNTIDGLYSSDDPTLSTAPTYSPTPYVSPSPLPPPDPMIAQCHRWGYENSDVVYNLVAQQTYQDPSKFDSPPDANAEATRAPCMDWLLSKSDAPPVNGTDPALRPLFLAMENGFPEVANVIIAHGADVNLADDRNLTPLYIAADQMQESVVTALLAKGADPNKYETSKGAPPIFTAVAHERTQIVRALLDHKADPNLVYSFSDDDKESALDTSTENIIVLQSFVDDEKKSDDSKTFDSFQVQQYELDDSPKLPFQRKAAEPMRSIDQLMSDAKSIDGMLRAANAKCATNPCGGTIGASDQDLKSDPTAGILDSDVPVDSTGSSTNFGQDSSQSTSAQNAQQAPNPTQQQVQVPMAPPEQQVQQAQQPQIQIPLAPQQPESQQPLPVQAQ
jgi:Ankyrin repeats (3 copies)